MVVVMEGEDERRRKMLRLREGAVEVVLAGGGEVVLWEEKRPEVRVGAGAGGGVGSRRLKRGMVYVVVWG